MINSSIPLLFPRRANCFLSSVNLTTLFSPLPSSDSYIARGLRCQSHARLVPVQNILPMPWLVPVQVSSRRIIARNRGKRGERKDSQGILIPRFLSSSRFCCSISSSDRDAFSVEMRTRCCPRRRFEKICIKSVDRIIAGLFYDQFEIRLLWNSYIENVRL